MGEGTMTDEGQVPDFPPEPPEDAPARVVIRYYRQVMDIAKRTAQPLSMRMRALTSIGRFAERADRVLERDEAGEHSLGSLAVLLEMRDMARAEQQWVDDFLRDTEPVEDVRDVLHYYKLHLAQVEATSMNGIAYIGSDREDDPEHGAWWANWAGATLMRTLAVAPALMSLPAE